MTKVDKTLLNDKFTTGPVSSVANRIAVFSGTGGDALIDGGKTIAELVPAGYNDLLMSVALMAMQLADNTNRPLYTGTGGNVYTDSFDTTEAVDVAGATNLDTSVAGLLKPTQTYAVGTMLMHLDGANGSTVFTDEIGAKAVTRTGTGTISTAQFKFGGASYAGISGGYLSLAGHADFRPGTGDFTLDFQARPGASQFQVVWDMGANGANALLVQFDNSLAPKLTVYINSVLVLTESTGITAASAFAHYEVSRSSGTIKIFRDGVQTATAANAVAITNTAAVQIGGNTANVYLNGFLDEVRWTNGVAVHTAAFTPPVAAYAAAVNNVTVSSVSFTALAVPTKMKALLRVKEVDAAVAGTDYTLECSRDGGTTWTAATLTELFTQQSPTANIRVVDATEVSVSGQPSGTAPRWRFKTLNNKMIELHDAYLYWS